MEAARTALLAQYHRLSAELGEKPELAEVIMAEMSGIALALSHLYPNVSYNTEVWAERAVEYRAYARQSEGC